MCLYQISPTPLQTLPCPSTIFFLPYQLHVASFLKDVFIHTCVSAYTQTLTHTHAHLSWVHPAVCACGGPVYYIGSEHTPSLCVSVNHHAISLGLNSCSSCSFPLSNLQAFLVEGSFPWGVW